MSKWKAAAAKIGAKSKAAMIREKFKQDEARKHAEPEQDMWECECGTRKYSPEDWKHHAKDCPLGTDISGGSDAKFAKGGMACPPDCPECISQDLVHAIRKKFFKGGAVDNIEESYGETYDERNEDMADGELYDDDQISSQPKDSNEHGDKLKDEDKHGKSLFKKIKAKKAQPGDRGKY